MGKTQLLLRLAILLCTTISVFRQGATAQTKLSPRVPENQNGISETQNLPEKVSDEVATSVDHPREREQRLAKNTRYNGGSCDLTKGEDIFIEQYEPRALPTIPLAEGAIAFTGEVSKVEAFLSADRTHVYSETTWKVDEVFEQPNDFELPSDRTIITDQIGGALKLYSGRVARDNTRNGFMGKPYLGGRYVVFVKMIHKNKDLTVIKAYELRDGKVFDLTEDGARGVLLSSKPNQPDFLSSEEAFLQAVRSLVAKERGGNLSENLE